MCHHLDARESVFLTLSESVRAQLFGFGRRNNANELRGYSSTVFWISGGL
jgi:hypothetical protein